MIGVVANKEIEHIQCRRRRRMFCSNVIVGVVDGRVYPYGQIQWDESMSIFDCNDCRMALDQILDNLHMNPALSTGMMQQSIARLTTRFQDVLWVVFQQEPDDVQISAWTLASVKQ